MVHTWNTKVFLADADADDVWFAEEMTTAHAVPSTSSGNIAQIEHHRVHVPG